MRSLWIVIMGIMWSCAAAGQTNPAGHSASGSFTYGEMAISYGNYLTGKLGINAIFPNDNIFSFTASCSTHRDPGTPSDFQRGLVGTNPQQILYMTGVCYGKVFYTNSLVRFTLKGGLATGYASTPSNYTYGGGLLSASYTYDHTNQFTVGLLLNPTIEFPITRRFGFSAGLYADIDYISPAAGVEVSMLFGKLRSRRSRGGY